MAGKSPYSKGAPLDRALRMALRDTADKLCALRLTGEAKTLAAGLSQGLEALLE